MNIKVVAAIYFSTGLPSSRSTKCRD